MNDYIELGPDDVIREGDEVYLVWLGGGGEWKKVNPASHGGKACLYTPGCLRRPRSNAIRDAALELLREDYAYCIAMDFVDAFEREFTKYKALREALGVSVEELSRR